MSSISAVVPKGIFAALIDKRRTFAEVISDLKPFSWTYDEWEKIGVRACAKGSWVIQADGSFGYETVDDEYGGYSDNISAEELIAIATACKEISANYKCGNCSLFIPNTNGKGICCGLDMKHNPAADARACDNFAQKEE